jgi:hypothetical protein
MLRRITIALLWMCIFSFGAGCFLGVVLVCYLALRFPSEGSAAAEEFSRLFGKATGWISIVAGLAGFFAAVFGKLPGTRFQLSNPPNGVTSHQHNYPRAGKS